MLQKQSLKFYLLLQERMCARAVKLPADLWLLYFLRSGKCLAEWRRCQGVTLWVSRAVLCCRTKTLKD